jgi:hypothetical protein
MFKKLFIIAAFSVALLASAEAFADGWWYGVLQFENTSTKLKDIKINPLECWFSTDRSVLIRGTRDVSGALSQIGTDNYELVSVTTSGNETIMYFKRPK